MTSLNTYIVKEYRVRFGFERQVEVDAVSADDAIDMIANKARGRHGRQYASYTRRWQNSPEEADRDNAHAQADSEGLRGWAAVRKGVVPAEAEARNDSRSSAGYGFRHSIGGNDETLPWNQGGGCPRHSEGRS